MRTRTDGGGPVTKIKGTDYVVDRDYREVYTGREWVRLTEQEFDLLAALGANKIMTKSIVAKLIFGDHELARMVPTLVWRLRRKIGPGAIENIAGRGYRLRRRQ